MARLKADILSRIGRCYFSEHIHLILPLYKSVESIYHLVIISNILSLMVIIYNNFLYTIALFMLHHLLKNRMRRLT